MDADLDLPEYDEIFDRDYTNLDQESCEDMIEKCVILTHIFHRDF